MCTVILVFLALLFLEFDEYVGDDVMMLVEVVMHMATVVLLCERQKKGARELMSCQAITMDPKMLLLTSAFRKIL